MGSRIKKTSNTPGKLEIMREKLETAIEASINAGREIMKIYEGGDFHITSKDDDSPLTLADKRANEIIIDYLKSHDIPVISEENKEIDYIQRKQWSQCWIVDPLDGTKEFIKKNGEFTVNIAFINQGSPEMGVIYAPALKTLYFAVVSESKAYRYKLNNEDIATHEVLAQAEEIRPASKKGDCLKVVGSRSHMNSETEDFISKLKKEHGQDIEIVSKGSSLKFCLVAEGEAHIYPRFAPTMEWDTAAGQAICEAVGLSCIFRETGEPMRYNRENLLNGHFSVSYEG